MNDLVYSQTMEKCVCLANGTYYSKVTEEGKLKRKINIPLF